MRLALMAVGRKQPGGQVVSFEELRVRANSIESSDYRSRGDALPGLSRDLHSTLAAGRDVIELLDLAVMVHAQTTRGWLYVVGAPLDLRREAATLAQRMAEERDDPAALGVAAWGAVIEMIAAGAFDLAQDELNSVTVPTNRSLVAAADKRPGDADATLEHAAELAQRSSPGRPAACQPAHKPHGHHAATGWCIRHGGDDQGTPTRPVLSLRRSIRARSSSSVTNYQQALTGRRHLAHHVHTPGRSLGTRRRVPIGDRRRPDLLKSSTYCSDSRSVKARVGAEVFGKYHTRRTAQILL